jgi:fused signal recognition particle receptor
MGWFDKLKSGLTKTSQKVSDALNVATPEAQPEPTPEKTEAPEIRKSGNPVIRKGLLKTVKRALGFGALTIEQRDTLEEALIAADTGPRAATELAAQVAKGGPDSPAHALADAIEQRLAPLQTEVRFTGKPSVILLVGVNGSGKTTTLGKLAAQWVGQRKKVIVGAADTFRAGAVAQLAEWCQRAKVPLVQSDKPGGDPAGVAYQAVEQGLKTQTDIVLIDTAGRLPNREDLMAELAKITRAVTKAQLANNWPDAKPEVWLVLDATLGQATLNHVKLFRQVAGVTGLVVTKLDSSAKGGFLLPLADEKLPVVAIGVGEDIDDLGKFDARAIAQGMAGLKS